jgi:hypothetical protein
VISTLKAVPGRATTVVSCPTEPRLNVADSREGRRKEVARSSGSQAVQHADSLEWNFGLARAGTRTKHNASSLNEMMERPMSRAIVLTGAAVLLAVLAKRGRRIRSENSDHYMDRTSFKELELTANNLKIATKEVDHSAARVPAAA